MEKMSLIYIKNYQALSELVAENQKKSRSYRSQLPTFIGKLITVFVDSGGASGSGFTGILVEILSDSIKLITAIPSVPPIRKNCHCKKNHSSQLGTSTTIMLEHITAITYNFV
jgi:hypothetical protein